MDLEHALLRVPFERLSNVFKNSTRSIEKDLNAVVQSIRQLCSTKQDALKPQSISSDLQKLITKLEALKKKLDEVNRQEEQFMDLLQNRLHFLQRHAAIDVSGGPFGPAAAVHEDRLNRMIIDFALRNELWDTAAQLSHVHGLSDFVEVELYISKAKKIIYCLEKHDVSEALKFCVLNRTRLKKLGNTLGLELRIQEFVLLVSKSAYTEAIRYAQEQLAPLALESPVGLSRVKHGMAMLAFGADPNSEISVELNGPARWHWLKSAFKDTFQQLYGMMSMPPLNLAIEIGLSAMKMPSCGHAETATTDCPVCSNIGSSLAVSLPLAQIGHSTLVCPITKRLMDEDNFPLVLPNGFVYSRQALEEMATRNEGMVYCPRSGDQYPFASLKRAFIL
eukprot:TRINITY_DN6314_c0_g1_i1.p1 TRINITY_DN6314_c0_g1~~TRINITY_DN6314_c0_g1_i1.p1  ORF type:complete len:392 (+),score=52.56 TRINITY_DN6314_c0_g1_i1:127-1302(+)